MRTRGKHTDAGSGERGTALVFALVISLAMAGTSSALLAMSMSTGHQRERIKVRQHTFYAVEAGLADAVMRFQAELVEWPIDGEVVRIGSSEAPVEFGGSSYWVEIAQLDARSYTVTSHGSQEGTRESIEIVLADAPEGIFQWSAFGDRGVELASNATVDSYDSSLGAYESQVRRGLDHASENGHVGTNADLVLRSNAEIHGDARPGPNGILDDSAPRTSVSGSTSPLDEPYDLVPIVVPEIASSGSIDTSGDIVLGPGDVHLDSLEVNPTDTVTIIGPADVVIDDLVVKSNGRLVLDGSAGMIDLYGTGDFELRSNSTVVTATHSALDVTLLLTGDTSGSPPARVELESNSNFVGAVYAPNADVELSSNFVLYGSIVSSELELSSNSQIHFDEALRYDTFGDTEEYVATLWRRVAHP